MLFGDDSYIVEFCEAGITSFSEFNENFSTHLLNRNMKELRNAGHKIKPGAQMMGADEIVDEYTKARTMLEDNASTEKLEQSVQAMDAICSAILEELNTLSKEYK
ncbi:taurine dioxygenase [Aliifodinibius sp. 1BSP15-2V2]|uniref:Taurine dioxygenase n=2 Tax=Fodinibius salsisoli TaxID=2820877 RepID=A0ABT3PT99_9BACT|nr:taurine dioxygenase [Fodinibius salsisoli]